MNTLFKDEELAIYIVTKAFKDQKRKKEDINLSYHSIMVGYMLKDANLSKEVILAGFLHDLIEDTEYTYEDIKNIFNKTIADYVLSVSENNEIDDWIIRKKEFLKRLENSNNETLYIELADKLQNLISDYPLYMKYGREYILNNHLEYYNNTKWFYQTLQELFNKNLKTNELLNRYNEIVNAYYL